MKIIEQNKLKFNELLTVYQYVQQGARISDNFGDMKKAVYDPRSVAGDAFDMDNMIEGVTNKILSATERAAIAANTSKVSFPEAPIDDTQYARKNAGWEEIALPASSGVWEFVKREVVTTPISEILFDTDKEGGGLDFTLYDYKVEGNVYHSGIPGGNPLSWYATEADAASVVPSEYTQANRFRVSTSLGDLQNAINTVVFPHDAFINSIKLNEAIFSLEASGALKIFATAMTAGNSSIGNVFSFVTNGRMGTTTPPNKLGLYIPTSPLMDAGTYLILSRRART